MFDRMQRYLLNGHVVVIFSVLFYEDLQIFKNRQRFRKEIT